MIAKTSSGKSFYQLGRYLAAGRNGTETDRMAWSAGRNLPVDDPQTAAVIMRATAQQNRRVEKPVYHFSISFHRDDAVTRDVMECVVDRVLDRLGLKHHEAVLVAHQDRTHPHVHVMVNRVHPDTGLTWERWKDRPQIEQVLRTCEHEYGLRHVPGRLATEPGVDRPERTALNGHTGGELRQAARGTAVFVEQVRMHAGALQATASWRELEVTLADHGLHLARRGQGLVIGDGTHYVKASRVHRDLSLRHLERRFGKSYADGAKEPPLPYRAVEIVRQVRAVEAAHAAKSSVWQTPVQARAAAIYRARLRTAEATATVAHLEAAHQRARLASKAFSLALIPVFADIRAAKSAFEATVTVRGRATAVALLASEPERFGQLRATTRPRGLLRRGIPDDSAARAAAPEAAVKGAAASLTAWERPGRETLAAARSGALDAIARQREAESRGALARDPRHEAEAILRRATRGLIPAEAEQVRRLLTRPQYLLVLRARQAARNLFLGRDGYER